VARLDLEQLKPRRLDPLGLAHRLDQLHHLARQRLEALVRRLRLADLPGRLGRLHPPARVQSNRRQLDLLGRLNPGYLAVRLGRLHLADLLRLAARPVLLDLVAQLVRESLKPHRLDPLGLCYLSALAGQLVRE